MNGGGNVPRPSAGGHEVKGLARSRFQVVGQLGRGAMTELYLCRLQGVAGFEKEVVVERVDRQGFPGLGAGDQIIEIAPAIRGPDLFDDHRSLPACSARPV